LKNCENLQVLNGCKMGTNGYKVFFTGNGINSNSSGPTGTQLLSVFTFQHHGYCSTSDFISFMDDFFLVFMT